MMKTQVDCKTASALLLEEVLPVEAQAVPLSQCFGRVLAQDVDALDHVPPFDRSPYDGYAFRAADSRNASKETPVTLEVLEEIAAGMLPTQALNPGTTVKILTGAPLPQGADTVVKYEDTSFTADSVTLYEPSNPGGNVVKAGEDVRKGERLAQMGSAIDEGTVGTLASQGIAAPLVYRKPVVGIISTGNEVVEISATLPPGKIRNANRHSFEAALIRAGCEPKYIGLAGDTAASVSDLIVQGLERCDAVILTGGVSVGDYDMTPAAFDLIGITPLFRGVMLKPGGACLYGVKDSKLICGLSGNPASAITNFNAVAQPAFRKLAGFSRVYPEEITLTLATAFNKSSPSLRMLRGRLDLSDGTAKLVLRGGQGNAVLSSMIGCDVMALVPPGSGPLPAGTKLKGFVI